MQDVVGDFTQAADADLLIELGGTDAGTGDDFHDQLNVDGQANLAGSLIVELWDDFTPEAGDEFVIATYDSVVGSFDDAEGLFGLHEGIWFEIVQTGDATTAGSITLVARELVPEFPSALDFGAGADFGAVGEVLNFGYFSPDAAVEVPVSFTLGGIDVDADLTLGYDDARDRLELSADLDITIGGRRSLRRRDARAAARCRRCLRDRDPRRDRRACSRQRRDGPAGHR